MRIDSPNVNFKTFTIPATILPKYFSGGFRNVFKNFFNIHLVVFLMAMHISSIGFSQQSSPCSGNVPIQNLPNGMDYTITVGPTSGDVVITVTVVDNPAGLVGFLGGPGNPISFPNGSGTFTYNLTGQANPYVLNMFFNWAAGGQGNSTAVSCSSAVPTICTGNVPIQNLANGMNYTITSGPVSGNVTISLTVVDNPAGLVGFLGGPGNPISFPNGSGTFTYNLTGQATPYVLNMFFNWAAGGQGSSTAASCPATAPPPTTPTVAAPTPTCPAGNVKSMFSNTYTNVGVDTWRTGWSSATLEDVQVAGNDTKKYTNLDFVGIETTGANLIDASAMTYFHVDFWTPNMTTFRVKLVDIGANGVFGGGDDVEHEIVINNPSLSAWNSYDIPFSAFTNLTTRAHIAQLIFSGLPVGQGTVFIDNVYFTTCLPTTPSFAAPTPACPSGTVTSMFSNAYTNVPVDTWRTGWSNATLTDVQVAGNDTKRYTNLDYVGVETTGANLLNLTSRSYMHLDIWTPNMTTFRIKLVDFGANGVFGGGDDKEHEIVISNPPLSTWNSYDIPLSDFTNLTSRSKIAQLIFSGIPVGQGTVFIDNVYFSNCGPVTPEVAAPVPTCPARLVKSMFSNTYTNVGVDTWRTFWSSAVLTDVQIAGNDTKKYTNLDFVGIETTEANLIDASNMTYLHLDIWTPNMTTFRIKLVDFGANGIFQGGDDKEHELVFNNPTPYSWNSYDIPLSSFTGLTTKAHIAQLILSGIPVGQGTLFVDNVYFSTCGPATLPIGWSSYENVNCDNGSNFSYNSSTQVFTGTSVNCYYPNPFSSDELAFAQYDLCGNGSITAEVTNFSGSSQGWAGVTMRESNAAGAKKAQLMTNLSQFSRREFRTTTNGTSYPQQFASQNRYWLRITRTGNQFVMFVSPNGTTWYPAGSQNISMNNCLEIGLVVSNYTENSSVTAKFANVSVTGGGQTRPAGNGNLADDLFADPDFTIMPNPTSGFVEINMSAYNDKNVQMEIYNLQGKLIKSATIDTIRGTEEVDMTSFVNGMYIIRMKAEGLPDVTKRVVVQH